MDNKKLMKILLRDAGETEKIIAEIREAGSFDPLDMELLQTRISGIRQLLQVACENIDAEQLKAEPVKPDIPAQPEIMAETVRQPGWVQPVDPVKTRKESKPEKKAEPPVIKSVEARPKAEPRPSVAAEVKAAVLEPMPETEIKTAKIPAFGQTDQLPVEISGDFGHSREEKPILAEKFSAGKSLNDLLVGKSKDESKFSHLPLNSLAAGIGTNERFLFTRELFNGDMESFNEAIHKIDAMGTIQEATGFLRDNFSWEKSETSMRFIELIKRRFTT